MFRFKRRHFEIELIALFIAAIIGIWGLGFVYAEEAPSKNIVIINSYHKGLQWTDDETDGMIGALKASGIDATIYTEYMDWKRNPNVENKKNFYNSIKNKYSDKKIDIVLATDDTALTFALENRSELLNNAPVIFCGVNNVGVENIVQDNKNVTGIIEEIDPSDTLKMALEINPAIKNIYIVFDNSESGRSTGKLVMDKIESMKMNLTAIPLNHLSHDELINTVRNISKDNIILVTTYFSDAMGTIFEFDTISKEISTNSNVPVYHLYDFGLNNGAFGGDMMSGRLQGINAAELALRVIHGEDINAISILSPKTVRKVFDYQQLKRFNVSMNKIPKDSEIINKPFSFFDTYKNLVFGTMGVLGFLVLFIGILLFYIDRIEKMKKVLSNNNEELTQLYEELAATDEELQQQFDTISVVKDNLAESEERFRVATEGSSAVIWDYNMETREYYFSDRWFELLGYKKNDTPKAFEFWWGLIHPDDVKTAENARSAHLEGKTPFYNCDYRIKAKNGDYIWFQVRGKVTRDHNGKNSRFAGSIIDITEKKAYEFQLNDNYQELEATYEELMAAQEELNQQFTQLVENQAQLKLSEERYRLIIEGTNDGIWEIDYKNKEQFYSPRWFELLGYSSETDSLDAILPEVVHPKDRERTFSTIEEHLKGKTDFFQCEYRLRQKDGTFRWFLGRGKALMDMNGQAYRMAGSSTDIHELKESQEKLHHLAYYDSLSGLPNRLFLLHELEAFFNTRSNKKAALFFLDVDNFKYINDTLGHIIGDQIIKKVSERLSMLINDNGMLFRLGGDDFVIFIESFEDHDEVIRITEALLQGFKEVFQVNESKLYLSMSIGISQYPKDGSNVEELLKTADVAMHKAKEVGKGNYIIYDIAMQQAFKERMTVEKFLRNALEQNEFRVYYQPQYNVKTGKISGFEALIRWISPELGIVSPGSFIKIAEDDRLIIPIGNWVLKTACSFVKSLEKSGYGQYKIAVNISVIQLIQEDFVENLLNILEGVELSPELLEIEITESIVIESFESIVNKLQMLKSKGISIALDDFGTGYSSLSYLKQLPISTLKVDKSFISNVPDSNSLTSSIVMIGHKMGMEVVAEGVETEVQLAYLKKIKCDAAQGFLMSRPIPEDEIYKLLESNEDLNV